MRTESRITGKDCEQVRSYLEGRWRADRRGRSLRGCGSRFFARRAWRSLDSGGELPSLRTRRRWRRRRRGSGRRTRARQRRNSPQMGGGGVALDGEEIKVANGSVREIDILLFLANSTLFLTFTHDQRHESPLFGASTAQYFLCPARI